MTERFATAAEDLRARNMLPDSYQAILLAGSIVRGWGNATSDVDVYVIVDEPWRSPTSSEHAIQLRPGLVTGEEAEVDGVRWDIRYWLAGQVDELITKVSWEVFKTAYDGGSDLTPAEIMFLDRLRDAVAPGAEQWLAKYRQLAAASAFRPLLTVYRLNRADSLIEDALGQLRAGDVESSVLSARYAFGWTIDALVASHGECGHNVKWRARRLKDVATDAISFDDYWAVETMRAYRPEDPSAWVLEVLALCRRLSAEVSIE